MPSADASAEPGLVAGAVSALGMLLAAPWWLVLWAAPPWVPLVLNLVVHAVLLQVVSRRPAVEDRGERPRSRSAQFGLALAAGALVWGAWLGWDHASSYDVVTRQVESPYVTLQVLGCALTVGLVTALLAARWSPLAAAAGVSVGFWLCWTVEAAASDPTGLYGIGAVMLGGGLAAGTAVAAAAGRAAGAVLRARRHA